jgi:hypothetical protein
MAKGGEARGGAFDIKGIRTGDSPKEQTIRGGSGTSQEKQEKMPGGDFSPEGAKNGYPSNK